MFRKAEKKSFTAADAIALHRACAPLNELDAVATPLARVIRITRYGRECWIRGS
jgi:hypothetical protein